MKKLFWVILAAVITAGLTLSACGTPSVSSVPASSSPSGPSSVTQSPLPGQQAILKIGVLAPLGIPDGPGMQKWINLFAKVYNEQGGWDIGGVKYQIQPTVYDCGIMDANKTRTAVEKAVLQDGIKYIVCTFQDVAAVDMTITEPNKVLWMGCDFTDATADPKLNYAIRGSGLHFAQALPFYIARDAVAKGAKTGLAVDPDTQQGTIANLQHSTAMAMAGLQVIPAISFPNDTVDFAPIATKIMSLKPDYVDLAAGSYDQNTNLIGELKNAGYKGSFYLGGTRIENLIKKVGKDYIEGLETAFTDPWGVQKDPGMVALMDRYVKEYGSWNGDACFWMNPWFLFQDAVNNTKSIDVDVLAKYLQNSKKAVMTFSGYTQLFARPDLNNTKTIDTAPSHYLGVFKDGVGVNTGKTVSVKDQYLTTIKMFNQVDVYQKYWDQYGKPQFPPEESFFDFSDLTK